jgi:hypothetical protein
LRCFGSADSKSGALRTDTLSGKPQDCRWLKIDVEAVPLQEQAGAQRLYKTLQPPHIRFAGPSALAWDAAKRELRKR